MSALERIADEFVTPTFCDGRWISRAHVWDEKDRYSTKTFATESEAWDWIKAHRDTRKGD